MHLSNNFIDMHHTNIFASNLLKVCIIKNVWMESQILDQFLNLSYLSIICWTSIYWAPTMYQALDTKNMVVNNIDGSPTLLELAV